MILRETDDPVALVCGADSAFGAAVAETLSEHGARLALYDADGDAADRLDALSLSTDAVVVSPESVNGDANDGAATDAEAEATALVQATTARFDRLDVLVNLYTPPADAAPSDVLGYADTLLARCHAAGRTMATQDGPGSIVNHSIMPALVAGTPLDSPLMVLQESVRAATQSACVEYGRAKVRANCIATGLFDVPAVTDLVPESIQDTNAPLGRWGEPEDVASVVGFFALENDYMSGQRVVLDGGLTATT